MGIVFLVGCSTTPNSDKAYISNAAVPIKTGPITPERQEERAATEKVPDVKLAPPTTSGNLQPARLISFVRPVYPYAARIARQQGTVTVAIVIAKDGTVVKAKLVSATNDVFIASALDAVIQWKFRPATIDGVPVSITSAVPVVFTLE
jgi:protein TonB